MRRVGFVCAFIVVLVAAAGAWTESASAYSGGPGSPITDPANLQRLKSMMRDINGANPSPYGTNTATGAAGTAAEVETGMTFARGAAGVLPRLGTIGIGILAAYAAGQTGWKIGTPIGGYIYKKITGEVYGGTTSSLVLSRVRWLPCGTSIGGLACSTATSTFFGGAVDPPGWYFVQDSNLSNQINCDALTYATCSAGAYTQAAAMLASEIAANGGTLERSVGGPNGTCTTNVTPQSACVIASRTDRQMKAATTIQTDTAAGYAGSAVQKDASAFAMPSSTTDAEAQAAADELGANNSSTGTPAQEGAIDAINHSLDPGYQHGDPPPDPAFAPFILPQPLPSETYFGYVERLRARGWIGTLTVEPASALEAAADPASAYATAPLHAPAGVQVSGTSMVWVYDAAGSPLHGDLSNPEWPDNPPHVPTRTTPITIKEKPGSSVFPPGGGGGGGGGDLDFSPLTDLDPGCKFPYGFVCYATTVTGYFDVAPDAPVFDFNIDCPAMADCAGGQYEYGPVDLNVMDDYMSMWRTILAFVIWIGAVYLLATRLLGFNAGGDPGEAIDDAWMGD